MYSRHTGLVLIGMLAFSILLAGCGAAAPKEEATPTPVLQVASTVKPTYKVEPGTIVDDVNFTGRIAPIVDEQLFFRGDGRLAKLAVAEGAQVKKGDVLAELEISDLLNQLAQAQVTLQTSQLKATAAEQTVADQRALAESTLRTAKLRLDQLKVKDPSPSMSVAAGNKDKARITLEAAQHAYDAKSWRNDIGASIEAGNLEKATIDYQIATAQADLAAQSVKSWEYDVQLQQEAVAAADAALKRITATVDPVLAQDVAKNQLVVDRLNAQVANSRIVSPMDGEVTEVGATAGQNVSAYKPILTVAQPQTREISADLISSVLQRLSVGQSCQATIANYPSQVFNGVIRRIPAPTTNATLIQEDRTTRITLTDKGVTPEMGALVRVTCVLEQKDQALWIPPDALRTFQGKEFVLVQDGDSQLRVPVKVGIRTDDRLEILSGLTAGQIVVGQ